MSLVKTQIERRNYFPRTKAVRVADAIRCIRKQTISGLVCAAGVEIIVVRNIYSKCANGVTSSTNLLFLLSIIKLIKCSFLC